MNKKIFSVFLFVTIVVTMLPLNAFANGETVLTLEELREEKGAITIEAYNIGQGFLMEPSLFDKNGKSTGDITIEALTSKNIDYKGSTSYFSGFAYDDTVEATYPVYLMDYVDSFDTMGDGNGYLEEFDYSQWAGWCYTINDWWASLGADSSYPGGTVTDYNTSEEIVLGDVIRWHFSVYGYGTDCGFSGNVMAEYMGGNLFIQEDKSDLIFILAAINDYYGNLDTDDIYETALSVAANPLATASEITNQETILKSYIENTFLGISTKTEITKYDEENVYFTFSEEGISISVIFSDYENDCLNKVKPVTVVTQKTNGENIMSVPVPEGIKLSVNDKIMLWKNFTTCVPLCRAQVLSSAATAANSY